MHCDNTHQHPLAAAAQQAVLLVIGTVYTA
jgi:hypothetical protein